MDATPDPKPFAEFRAHIKDNGYKTLLAAARITALTYALKLFIGLFTDNLIATTGAVLISAFMGAYGSISNSNDNKITHAFWKGWVKLSPKTHILIIVCSVIFIWPLSQQLSKLIVFIKEQFRGVEATPPTDLKNLVYE